MSSLVEELQRDALNSKVRVSDLLRKAKTIAVKLDLPELAAWVEKELGGYNGSEPPAYRFIRGQVKAHDPFSGWVPVIFHDATREELYSTVRLSQRVAELEDVVVSNERK